MKADKKRILYLRHVAGGGGGADTVILNTASLIDRERYRVIIAYVRKETEDISAVMLKTNERNLEYYDLPGSGIIDISQIRRIGRLIRERDIRIVHCHDPKTDFYGYLLRLLFPKVKFVSTIHGWIERRKRSRYYMKMDRFALKRFDAVIAVSMSIMQTAQKYGISRLHLIHNSIDINKWQPLHFNKRDGFRIGFVGRLSKEKGPLDFVLTAKKMLAKYPECEFLVAGSGPEEGGMKALIRAENIEKSFKFSGHLKESDLLDLYNGLDLLLLPSYTEGLPMTVLEACAMRVPVIAAKVGGVGEIIEDGYNGLLGGAGDVDAMAANALKLLEDRELAKRLADNGRAVVERKFSLNACVKKIEEVYSHLEDVNNNPDI
jgi:glycosyltransferase involved in cell wall biosynthesis